MKRYLYIFAVALVSATANAQDTYENARVLGADLNGTARYVGMGGALEALGAEISTMSTNPAAIGLFRHSYASLSFGMVSQEGVNRFDNLGKTNLSFDQAGFVYSMKSSDTGFINFGINYHKRRNFDQILSAANALEHASLSKHVFGKSTMNNANNGGYTLDTNDKNDWMGWNGDSNERSNAYTQLDFVYTNAVTMDDATNFDNKGKLVPINVYNEASDYIFNRAHSGYIADFDFNISGNINNRVYLGVTIGAHVVNYKGYSEYTENILSAADKVYRGQHVLADERKITGAGADIKLGVIFRPIEESPFRIGLSIATPTWYELRTENYTSLYNNTDPNYYKWGADVFRSSEDYKFRYYTPWQFGMSVGHTVGNFLALGATYEYSDYSSADTRIIDGYDEYGNQDSYSDRMMNRNTEKSLRGVSTLKLGMEMKPDPALAVRLGYNYVSPAYSSSSVRDNTINSIGNLYSSTADYTNWKDTHRITCGLGFKYDKMNFDVAYQYSVTNGTFHPFQNTEFYDPDDGTPLTNYATTTNVNNKRHQLLFTVGYTF